MSLNVSACFRNVTCTSFFSPTQCTTTQPGSLATFVQAAWNDSCQCPAAMVGYIVNQTCTSEVVSYRFAPENDAQREFCLQHESDAEVSIISLIVIGYFFVPLLALVYVGFRKTRTAKNQSLQQGSNVELAPRTGNRPLARVTFQNVRFEVKDKVILNNVSASLEPGKLTAIMGPSGCGKSTLLDILARRGRGAGNGVSGTILVNGLDRGIYWKRISAYVEQFDALFPHLTVREMLTYTAELRSASMDNVQPMVKKVLSELELEFVADTRIGDKFNKGISGGQARRVTVGLELLADPAVLLLDEPTSGLDSTSAKSLVETLKRLAANGCTVACTIHQPRSSTFRLFDNLILMKSGEMAYFGPVVDIPAYLKSALGVIVPKSVNLADFVVDLTYDKDDSEPTETKLDVSALTEAWKMTNYEVVCDAPSDDLVKYIRAQGVYEGSKFMRSRIDQMYILLRRSYTNLIRNRGYFIAVGLQNLQYLFYGLLFVGLRIYQGEYSNVPNLEDSAQSTLNTEELFKKNFLFQVMNTVCIVESVVIASAFLEKSIFLREYAAGSYSVLAYHAQWVVRLTVDAIWKGLLASVLSYFFPPMRMEADAFFFFWAVLMVVSTVGSSLGFFMASAVSDAEGAANIHNTIIGFMGTYAGFFLPSILIPIFTLWAYYLSFMKYSLEALLQNEWSNCASYYMASQFLSLDLTLTRWTNLLILMVYPIAFHIAALLSSLARTGELSMFCRRIKGRSNKSMTPIERLPEMEGNETTTDEPVAPTEENRTHKLNAGVAENQQGDAKDTLVNV